MNKKKRLSEASRVVVIFLKSFDGFKNIFMSKSCQYVQEYLEIMRTMAALFINITSAIITRTQLNFLNGLRIMVALPRILYLYFYIGNGGFLSFVYVNLYNLIRVDVIRSIIRTRDMEYLVIFGVFLDGRNRN